MNFITSNTFFNDPSASLYTLDEFKIAEKRTDHIISQWNSVVGSDDVVYHLGNFGVGSMLEISEIINKLNGTLILIAGPRDEPLDSYAQIGGIVLAHSVDLLTNFGLVRLNHHRIHIKDPDIIPVCAWDVEIDKFDFKPVDLKKYLREYKNKKKGKL